MAVFVDETLCDGCKICYRICPTDVFRMEGPSRRELKAVVKYPEDCMLCDLCQLDCPCGAVTVTPEKVGPLVPSWG